ncbi:Fatty acid synthase subunit alpha [Mycena indigotica]|uniref:Fatty acid synthase subunit alpha n=1 Tax=Mycena indigotica TaxID=2126181 RepID=A0A8H6S6X1_9AGAR|nr:Fatty acid synthase subunit alpha [Mycena indigotica]KAF7292917.1 Fatty acid synthase subunit alpha [Mycena indigotica]
MHRTSFAESGGCLIAQFNWLHQVEERFVVPTVVDRSILFFNRKTLFPSSSFLKKSPIATKRLLASEDTAYFLAISQRLGQKPAPFSCSRCHFRSLVQEGSRSSPRPAWHNIHAELIQRLLTFKYNGDEKVATIDYLAAHPIPPPVVTCIKRTQEKNEVTFEFVDRLPVTSFYWKLWYGDDAVLPQIDIHETSHGPEVTIKSAAVEQFCAIVGDQCESFSTIRNEEVTAPMDFAIVTGWQVCYHEVNFPAFIDGDLLRLVHLSNGFRMLDGEKPFALEMLMNRADAEVLAYMQYNIGQMDPTKGETYALAKKPGQQLIDNVREVIGEDPFYMYDCLDQAPLLEPRRLAVYLSKQKDSRWDPFIALSKNGRLFKNAMTTAAVFGSTKIAEQPMSTLQCFTQPEKEVNGRRRKCRRSKRIMTTKRLIGGLVTLPRRMG